MSGRAPALARPRGPGPSAPAPSRISGRDLVREGTGGLSSRPTRTLLTAVGVGIAIAAVVAILGISESSRAGLLAQLDRLGTNLLTVSPGQQLLGGNATLPLDAPAMIRRIGPVQATSATAPVRATVFKTDQIPRVETGGLNVVATQAGLLDTLRGGLADGVFLNAATARYPAVVLGADAAQYLGITSVADGVQIYLGRSWFTVVGILEPLALAPELDRSALIGFRVAESLFGIDGSAGTIYVRTAPEQVNDVSQVLAGTADPEHPEDVDVTRPSDALAARAAAAGAFTSLSLGLAAVALFVAAVGVANIMLMSVLERRSEIGLRRALGATRLHVGLQFLAEALVLAAVGGLLGVGVGAAAVAVFAELQGWTVVIPPAAVAGGLGSASAIGAVAGLYPAARAARMSPTEALRAA